MRRGGAFRIALVAYAVVVHALSNGVSIRPAAPHELALVARLQLDTFVPEPEPPQLMPLFASLYESNQRNARAGMCAREPQPYASYASAAQSRGAHDRITAHRRLKRLSDEIDRRVAKGSQILIAFNGDAEAAANPAMGSARGAGADSGQTPSGVVENGQYVEPGPPLLGTIDLSVQEMELPTHALTDGMYVSHMAVAPQARRCGIARALLAAVRDIASQRGEQRLYLHVEPSNAAAVALYETEGYQLQPVGAPYAAFTRALNLQDRAVLYAKEVHAGGDSDQC